MVGENMDREGGSVEVVLPGFQGVDDSEEFLVIDVIVSFCWREQLGEVRAGMPIAIRVGVEQDGTRGIFRGVGGDGEGRSEVGKVKDRF